MSHVFEAFVDVREYNDDLNVSPHIYTERYEIDAVSKHHAGREAIHKAERTHPTAAELDVRVTRMLY